MVLLLLLLVLESEKSEHFEIVLQFICYTNIIHINISYIWMYEESFTRFLHTYFCTHLNQNTFECLAHRHTAKFDNKITELKTGPFRFNLRKMLFM